MKTLFKKFAMPILAALLLHEGIWMVVVTLEQPILSAFFSVQNGFEEHFAAGEHMVLEEVSWTLSSTAVQVGEAMIPIVFGLILGFWVLYRKRQKKALA
jgi:hypothetical protein